MSSGSIAIIDSGGANIASLLYAFKRLHTDATLTTDGRLRDSRLIDVIRELTQPVLGICLGMHLLADASEEEDVECLGIIPGTARKLPGDTSCPVPNMGWCPVSQTADHELLSDIGAGAYFYFLHSYALPVSECTIAQAHHAEPFSAVVGHRNFVAEQFQPERSAAAGSKLLQNFVGIHS
jgi:glutamine amidotransferase